MFKIIAVIVVGVVLGIIFRSKIGTKKLSNITMWIIYALLLLLGISVGSNESIINNLHTIGLKATIIALASVLGSVIAAKIIYNKMYHNKKQDHEG